MMKWVELVDEDRSDELFILLMGLMVLRFGWGLRGKLTFGFCLIVNLWCIVFMFGIGGMG